jgi:hypothetical protein
MSTTAIAATNAYRQMIAQAAATGGAVSPIAFVAFGTGETPYTVDDIALNAEFLRIAASVSRNGVIVTAAATITGAQVGSRVLREVGAFTASGILVGRRIVAPKEFEPDTDFDIEIDFQY